MLSRIRLLCLSLFVLALTSAACSKSPSQGDPAAPGKSGTRPIIVKTKKDQYFVLPDNGLITPVIDRDGLASAREITNPNWIIQAPISSTFHGRDIFSPAGAHLAAGWEFNLVGPEVPQLVRLAP